MKKPQSKHIKNSGKAYISRAIASAAPRMTLECAERHALLLCGCKKIEAYSPEETVIATSVCRVRVRGACLRISFTGDGKISLCGTLSAIEFE